MFKVDGWERGEEDEIRYFINLGPAKKSSYSIEAEDYLPASEEEFWTYIEKRHKADAKV